MQHIYLDTNILFADRLRKLLFHLFEHGENFYPHWSQFGLNELSAVKYRAKKHRSLFQNESKIMELWPDAAIPIDNIADSHALVPDHGDNVISNIAIVGGCSIILSYNVKDFHSSKLKKFAIKAIHPDKFLLLLLLEDADHIPLLQSFEKDQKMSAGFLISFLSQIALPKYTAALKRRGYLPSV